ncbi:hypothetical protein F5888DRAFT_869588 [Russula emetica]|nr:hypothetical protein F5888DRAFT_869588 [Russula emetica]
MYMHPPVGLPDSPESCLRAVEDKIKFFEESSHAMKVYRNTMLVPISRLTTEILSIIFSLLPDLESSPPIPPFHVSRVCHLWREISPNVPYLWSHINFNKLTPAGVAVMLVRAKTAPLYLEVQATQWSRGRFEAFKVQIESHIHHTRHLSITTKPKHLKMFGQLVSSAPSLEFLSIHNQRSPRGVLSVIIPDTLFDGIAPKLTYLRLYDSEIQWQSPLLKGLRDLELLFSFPGGMQIKFYHWLLALKQMPQLERLVLHNSIPHNSVLSEGLKLTVDFPSLTELSISASVSQCAAVLAHLLLPALTKLCVNAKLNLSAFESMQRLIQCVAQNAHGPQDTEALQSLFIGGNKNRFDFVAWTMPRQDSDDSSIDFPDKTRPTRLELSILGLYDGRNIHCYQYDALLAALPLNSITSLTVKGRTPLSKEGWRRHASRWHKLERLRLFHAAVPAFRGMFEDASRSRWHKFERLRLFYPAVPGFRGMTRIGEDTTVFGDPLLPSLEELILSSISLNTQKVYYLCDMLIECAELGTPLRTLDLRTCTAANRAVQLLSEIVVDVQGPVKKESRDLNGRRQGGAGVFDGEGGRDEEDDEEPGFDDVPNIVGSWDLNDGDDEHIGLGNVNVNNGHNEDEDEDEDDDNDND